MVQRVFLLSMKSVAGQDSQLEIRVRGPDNVEMYWEWGGREGKAVPGTPE